MILCCLFVFSLSLYLQFYIPSSQFLPQLIVDPFLSLVENIYILNSNKTIDLVSHSMGGLVVASFFKSYPSQAETYIRSWTAVGVCFSFVCVL